MPEVFDSQGLWTSNSIAASDIAKLKQEGNEVTGSIRPTPDQQCTIEKGLTAGGMISFQAAMPVRAYKMRLTSKAGGSMEGEVSSVDGKVTGTIRLQRL